MVKNIDSSVDFYVNGLGFSMTESWVDQGKLKWCWLVIDSAALMLQEFNRETGDAILPGRKPGDGVEIFFICEDALAIYEKITLNGISAAEPFVGNNMWVCQFKGSGWL